MKPDLHQAIQNHFDAISNRDLEAFKSHLTKNESLYTIVQNGQAYKTPKELVDIHRDWFKDQNWIWEGSIVHTVTGEDMAMALIKYNYRAQAKDKPVETWLIYVFKIENGEWKIVHDQNTSLDFPAFAEAMG